MAELDAKRKRTDEAMMIVAVLAAGYFFVMLFVLGEFGSAMGERAALVFLPFPAACIAVFVLRTRSRWLRSDAALEQVRAAYDSLDALEAEIAESKRREGEKP